MDTRKLIDLLRATIDPSQRQPAEEQLAQVCRKHVLAHVHMQHTDFFKSRIAVIALLK